MSHTIYRCIITVEASDETWSRLDDAQLDDICDALDATMNRLSPECLRLLEEAAPECTVRIKS